MLRLQSSGRFPRRVPRLRSSPAWSRCVAVWSALALAGCGGIVADEWGDGQGTAPFEPTDPDAQPELPSAPDPGVEEELSFDCRREFTEPEVLFEDPGWTPQALSPSQDGLEFFYLRLAENAVDDPGLKRRLAYRFRASRDDDFSAPIPLPDVGGICEAQGANYEPAALDLSHDALRLYVGCNTMNFGSFERGPLFVARRTDRFNEFVLDPDPLGQVGISMGLTRDELTVFTTPLEATPSQVYVSTRTSLDEPFELTQTISLSLRNPEPSPTAGQLLGVQDDEVTGGARIVLSERLPDGSYSSPAPIDLPPVMGVASDFSPAVGPDCGNLYFSRIRTTPSFQVQVLISRQQ